MILATLATAGTLSGLVSANGYGAVTYEVDSTGYGVLTRFSDHLYQKPDAASDETWDLLYDSYFGLRAEGFSGWLTQSNGQSIADGTISIDRSRGSLTITEYTVAPMGLAGPGFVQLLRVRNDSAVIVDEISLFSLHNYHLGPEQGTSDESLSDAGGVLTETGTATGLTMVMTPVVTPTTIGCADVWTTVNAGGDLGSGCVSVGSDQVGGFQWEIGSLASGAETWVAVVNSFGGDAVSWVAGRSPQELLDAEEADWSAWHGPTPDGASTDEAATWRQMMAWLRMAQVREEGDPNGQLVASLPYADGAFTHVWNIAWARDGAYAARALAEGGHPEEAEAALRFLARKPGTYTEELGIDGYSVSVCRYYGDGTEWSDEDASGPNIELDDWGLYLWALKGAVDAGAAMDDEVERAVDGVAGPLVAVIDETGLLTKDSSIWERHWNGNQKHFTYSSAWAVRGLRDFAALSGDSAYESAADGIAAAIESQLVRDGVLVGNLEESDALDLAAADAFANGAVGIDITPSLSAWEALRTTAGGYHRNDDGDSYDEQEWIFVDLRLAEALFRTCHTEEGQALLDHVTALAVDNMLVLPELLDPATGEVEGPAPMIGFGAGVYALALHARAEVDCTIVEDSGDTGAGEGDSAPPEDTAKEDFYSNALGVEGCACGSTRGGGWLVVLLGLAAARRSTSNGGIRHDAGRVPRGTRSSMAPDAVQQRHDAAPRDRLRWRW